MDPKSVEENGLLGSVWTFSCTFGGSTEGAEIGLYVQGFHKQDLHVGDLRL